MKTRVLSAVAAVGIVCAHVVAMPSADAQDKPAAQNKPATQARPAAQAGPWAKVPALPTSCYLTDDQWQEQQAAAGEAVVNDHYKQIEINDGIRQAATDSFSEDPMALAARIQQQMMEDPANAQKIMEQMNQRQQQAQVESPAQLEKEQKIEDESKALMRQYREAFTKALGIGDARRAAIQKRLGGSGLVPWEWMNAGDQGDLAWYEPERVALKRLWDQAYVANCAQWWTATGPFHAYMKRYKDFLVQERIPHEKEYLDKPKLEQYATLGVDTTGWRTTTDYEAVLDYMKMASSLFDQRQPRPLCAGSACPP